MSGQDGERRIALVLRWGVFAAAGLLALAWLGSFVSGKSLGHSALPVGALLRGEANGLETTALLGLLTLGITPVARVALSVPVFARSGEKTQALIALGVLALLALSIAVGAVE